MTDEPTPNEEITTPAETAQPGATENTSTPPPVPRGIRASAKQGVSRARSDAAEAAKTALPLAKKGVAMLAFGGAYAAAYGAVFGYTVAKQIVPKQVKDAIKRGVNSGQQDAQPTVIDPTAPVGSSA